MFKLYFKKWLFILTLIISNFLFGLRIPLPLFSFLFWFLIALLLVCFSWLTVSYFTARLVLSRKIKNRVDEDGALKIETVIRNNGLLPVFNLVLEDNLSCAGAGGKKKTILIEYFKMNSSLILKYDCLCPLRGKYNIGPFAVYFFDPLGLFFFKKLYYVNSELYVYPKVFHVKKFPELNKGVLPWFGIETSRVSGDDDEFFGTREYKEGDPIKRIHWISTARQNKLIVRQFQRQSFSRATIVFNLEKDRNFGEGKERVGEYIIKIAASVANFLVERDISLEVIAHSEELVHIPFNKGKDHLEDILKFLAVARSESRVGLDEIFEEFSPYIQNDSTLIVIIPDTDQIFLSSMLVLKAKNVTLVPLIIKSSTFLYPFDRPGAEEDVNIIMPFVFNLNPLFFSRGDNLDERFS